eukprot:6026661-Amphidinium_carterae.1
MRWRGKELVVSREVADRVTLMDDVCNALLYIMAFKRATESRWVSIGAVCRTIRAARLCGLDGLLEHVLNQSLTSHYYIGGVARMSSEVMMYVAIAAV